MQAFPLYAIRLHQITQTGCVKLDSGTHSSVPSHTPLPAYHGYGTKTSLEVSSRHFAFSTICNGRKTKQLSSGVLLTIIPTS